MIDTIFYFPHSEADYNSALVSPGISSRTISFVPNSDGETGKIYKNGVVYGSTGSDSSDVSQQITNAILQANDYSNRRLSEAVATINSATNQKIQDAIASCNESADVKIANAMRNVVTETTDYTINVRSSNTGVTITQPGTNKSFYVDIPRQDSRVDGILVTLADITNQLSQLGGDTSVSDLSTRISQLESCCTTVQSTISTLNNAITGLQNRVSDLETQASLQPTTHTLTIANDAINVTAASGTFTIPVVQYDGTTVSITDSDISGKPTNPAWIHTFANNGYSYDANTSTSSRSVVLTIAYQGYTVTLTITQAGAQPQVTHTLTIANNGGVTLDSPSQQTSVNLPTVSYDGTAVSLTSSNIFNLPEWITVAQDGTLNIAQNTSYSQRSATITITYEGLSVTATITQPGAPEPEPEPEVPAGTLTIAQSAMQIGAESRTISLPTVSYNDTAISPSNLTVSVSTGITYSNGVITVPENNSGNTKIHTVNISYQGQTVSLTITQTDHILSFDVQRSVFTDTFTGAYNYSGYKSVVLYYDGTPLYQGGNNAPNGTYDNVTITYSSSNSNLNDILNISQSPNSIALQFNTNYSEDSRGGTLTFTYNGKSVTMTVEQEGADTSITRFHETSGGWQYEFDIDGYGMRGGNNPHPYFNEQYIQRSITEASANLVTAQLIDSNNTVVATLGANEEYSSTNDGTDKYIIERHWSSSDGLVIGIHLEKWQDAIDEYDNLTKVTGTIDGVTINAVPMKSILTKADEMGPRTFSLVVSQNIPGKYNYSATWDVVQYCNYGIKLGRGTSGQDTALGDEGFGSSLYGQPGNFTPDCDAITVGNTTTSTVYPNWSMNYRADYFCLDGQTVSLAIHNGNGGIKRMCGNSVSYPDYITSDQNKNIIIVKHFNGGPDVITSTYYGDFTDTSLSLTGMTLMTRHVKTGHTPTTATTGVTQYTNYSTIGDASLRYTTDSDWQQS